MRRHGDADHAPKDDLGYFTASGAREPLKAITGRDYDIPAVRAPLEGVREREARLRANQAGAQGRTFYRFQNPLLQPFTILYGLERGLIDEAHLPPGVVPVLTPPPPASFTCRTPQSTKKRSLRKTTPHSSPVRCGAHLSECGTRGPESARAACPRPSPR